MNDHDNLINLATKHLKDSSGVYEAFKASPEAKAKAYATQQTEQINRTKDLIKRLWARSESKDDMWADMAREAEASLKK